MITPKISERFCRRYWMFNTKVSQFEINHLDSLHKKIYNIIVFCAEGHEI